MKANQITAEKLRSIAEAVDIKIDWILNRLLAEAEAGETSMDLMVELSRPQIDYLKDKRFKVIKIKGGYEISF